MYSKIFLNKCKFLRSLLTQLVVGAKREMLALSPSLSSSCSSILRHTWTVVMLWLTVTFCLLILLLITFVVASLTAINTTTTTTASVNIDCCKNLSTVSPKNNYKINKKNPFEAYRLARQRGRLADKPRVGLALTDHYYHYEGGDDGDGQNRTCWYLVEIVALPGDEPLPAELEEVRYFNLTRGDRSPSPWSWPSKGGGSPPRAFQYHGTTITTTATNSSLEVYADGYIDPNTKWVALLAFIQHRSPFSLTFLAPFLSTYQVNCLRCGGNSRKRNSTTANGLVVDNNKNNSSNVHELYEENELGVFGDYPFREQQQLKPEIEATTPTNQTQSPNPNSKSQSNHIRNECELPPDSPNYENQKGIKCTLVRLELVALRDEQHGPKDIGQPAWYQVEIAASEGEGQDGEGEQEEALKHLRYLNLTRIRAQLPFKPEDENPYPVTTTGNGKGNRTFHRILWFEELWSGSRMYLHNYRFTAGVDVWANLTSHASTLSSSSASTTVTAYLRGYVNANRTQTRDANNIELYGFIEVVVVVGEKGGEVFSSPSSTTTTTTKQPKRLLYYLSGSHSGGGGNSGRNVHLLARKQPGSVKAEAHFRFWSNSFYSSNTKHR